MKFKWKDFQFFFSVIKLDCCLKILTESCESCSSRVHRRCFSVSYTIFWCCSYFFPIRYTLLHDCCCIRIYEWMKLLFLRDIGRFDVLPIGRFDIVRQLICQMTCLCMAKYIGCLFNVLVAPPYVIERYLIVRQMHTYTCTKHSRIHNAS